MSAQKPASFLREIRDTVVILVRGFAKISSGLNTGPPSSQRDFAMYNYYVVREFNGEKS